MSLQTTIKLAIDKAFAAAGDLVKLGTLTKKEALTYNWSTGEYSSVDSVTTIQAIITDTLVAPGEQSSSPETSIIVRSTDLGIDYALYSSITIDSVEYRISSVTQYEGIAMLKTRRG